LGHSPKLRGHHHLVNCGRAPLATTPTALNFTLSHFRRHNCRSGAPRRREIGQSVRARWVWITQGVNCDGMGSAEPLSEDLGEVGRRCRSFGCPRRGMGVRSVAEAPESGGGVSDSAFDDAFPGLFESAYRVAFRLLGSREDAAECAQEACARAFADWKRLSKRGDVAPWVVRVSSNLAIDRWRKARRSSTRRWGSDQAVTIPDRIDLYRALDGLPARQRDVVVLRFLADLPGATVAEVLGCSVSTVNTHAERGLSALRTVLDIDEKEDQS
jgi:RNA polymerase sigma factor (sigma-70 family)